MNSIPAAHSLTEPNDEEIRQFLKRVHTIAVVGLSSRQARASFGVSRYLQRQGYRIIPVNPFEQQVLGEKAYARLQDVPAAIDLVDVFRRSEFVPQVVDDALTVGAKGVWLQIGVIHAPAALKAQHAGLLTVMDRCLMVEHARLMH